MAISVSVASALYPAGYTEDGEDFVAEAYYVVAEADDGRTWARSATYRGAEAWDDGEGSFGFADVREEAAAAAEAEAAAVVAAGVDVEDGSWVAGYPSYGSPAHAAVGDAGMGYAD